MCKLSLNVPLSLNANGPVTKRTGRKVTIPITWDRDSEGPAL